MKTLDEFTGELIPKSLVCLAFQRPSKRWIQCLMAEWEDPVCATGKPPRGWLQGWRQAAKARYRAEYGNPMIWLWILSVVINLIWQWWLHRHDQEEMLAMRAEASR